MTRVVKQFAILPPISTQKWHYAVPIGCNNLTTMNNQYSTYKQSTSSIDFLSKSNFFYGTNVETPFWQKKIWHFFKLSAHDEMCHFWFLFCWTSLKTFKINFWDNLNFCCYREIKLNKKCLLKTFLSVLI